MYVELNYFAVYLKLTNNVNQPYSNKTIFFKGVKYWWLYELIIMKCVLRSSAGSDSLQPHGL